MLLRGANAVGYTSYPDNVIVDFVREACEQGIDIFRIFDSLNSIDNMRVSIDAVLETGAVCEPAICYTGDLFDKRRPKYSLKYYVQLAKQLEKLGAHFLAIKDMAGLCRPYAAFELVKALREEIAIPIHFHTHDTSGINAASLLKAADAGVDVADAAIASMSGGTSQPNLNSIVEALRQHAARHASSISTRSTSAPISGKLCAATMLPFDSGPKAGSARLYEHEIPGGQFTNLREQAAAMGLGHRWREVEKTYAEVNQLFGDIVKVTPSSKVVGDMALFLMANEMQARGSAEARRRSRCLAAQLRRRNVFRRARRPSGRLAEEIAEHHFAWPGPTERAARRQPASGELRRSQSGTGKESRRTRAARRSAQLSALSRRVPEIRRISARLIPMSACCRRPRSSTA